MSYSAPTATRTQATEDTTKTIALTTTSTITSEMAPTTETSVPASTTALLTSTGINLGLEKHLIM